VEWEVYHLNYDLEGETDTGRAKSSASLPLAEGASCCGS